MKNKDDIPGIDPVIAADGGAVPGACNTLGEYVSSLEDGQFDSDAYLAIRDLINTLKDHVIAYGGKAKGRVSIHFDFVRDQVGHDIMASFDVKKPKEPRLRTLMFDTADNRLTRVRPGQQQLFGIRDVSGGAREMRDAG